MFACPHPTKYKIVFNTPITAYVGSRKSPTLVFHIVLGTETSSTRLKMRAWWCAHACANLETFLT